MSVELITNFGWHLLSVFTSITIPLLIFYELYTLNRKMDEKLERVISVLQRIESLNRLNSLRSRSMLENRLQYLEETLVSFGEQDAVYSSIGEKMEMGPRKQAV